MKSEDLLEMSNAIKELDKWRATATGLGWQLDDVVFTFKSGTVARFVWTQETEPSIDPTTGVSNNVVVWEGWKIDDGGGTP